MVLTVSCQIRSEKMPKNVKHPGKLIKSAKFVGGGGNVHIFGLIKYHN